MRLFASLLALALLLGGCSARTSSPPLQDSGETSPSGTEALSSPASEQELPALEQEPPDSGQQPPSSGQEPPAILRLAIPEGYTLARIGMLLETNGFCTAEEFIDLTQQGDYSTYPLLAEQQADEHRCFRLEGYLFPATYEVYSTDTPENILHKILAHTEQMIDAELRTAIQASGYTVDQILTLASIIEKEAFGHEQMPAISSVLHNRLAVGMRLQCDVTITYVEGAIKPFIAGDIDRYNEYYNTYKCTALPAGAICNPGMDAIRAALAPADTDYLFFVTDSSQNYYYSDSWEGHQENVKAAGLGADAAPAE